MGRKGPVVRSSCFLYRLSLIFLFRALCNYSCLRRYLVLPVPVFCMCVLQGEFGGVLETTFAGTQTSAAFDLLSWFLFLHLLATLPKLTDLSRMLLCSFLFFLVGLQSYYFTDLVLDFRTAIMNMCVQSRSNIKQCNSKNFWVFTCFLPFCRRNPNEDQRNKTRRDSFLFFKAFRRATFYISSYQICDFTLRFYINLLFLSMTQMVAE